MKQPKTFRKLDELRVTRKSNAHAAPGGGESWAISYADMLMVLLSFFVMFFSLKEENPQSFDDQLKKISLSMKSLEEQKQAEAKGEEKSDGHEVVTRDAVAQTPTAGKNFSDIEEALRIEGVNVIDDKNQLTLTLENTAFKKASFKPSSLLLNKIDQIVTRLKPFESKIQLTIVGHTDKRVLRPRNKFLEDNFDLSSLRALRVLKHVLSQGFPQNRATARASSSFDRDARSVSLVIQLTDVSKAESKP